MFAIRIQDAVLFDPWIWASGRNKIQIRDRYPRSHFRELSANVSGYKYLNSLLRIRVQCLFDHGSRLDLG